MKAREGKRNVSLVVLFMLLIAFIADVNIPMWCQSNLKLHYTFNNITNNGQQVVDDSGNGYTATFMNGATIKQIGNYKVLDLGATKGYLDMGASVGSLIATLKDFSIATYLFVDPTSPVTDDGNFVWSFGNSDNMANDHNGGMFFTAKTTRFAISKQHWTGEQSVSFNNAFTKGIWKHVVYVQSGTTGSVYMDGVLVKTSMITYKPDTLGSTRFNYIGRSLYSTDAYLKNACLTDFRIYNKALTDSEISNLTSSTAGLNAALAEQQLNEAAKNLVFNGLDKVNANISFVNTASNSISITWVSSNTSVITNFGEVKRPAIGKDPAVVELTAKLSKGGQSKTKIFTAHVLPYYNDQTSVVNDAGNIILNGNLSNLRSNIVLPLKGTEGSSISWKSGNVSYLTSTGKILKLAPKGGGKLPVVLTATITKGKSSIQKTFNAQIAEDEGFSAYLFVYFTGNDISQEAIRFALSYDGYNYRALNNDNPVISSSAISSTGGVRDPHIYRGPDGKYYMVVTDMVSANGWNSNRAMVLLRSNDLITWQSSIVNIETKYGYTDLHRVWAPQTIYDEKAGKFMVYFSLQRDSGPDIIYYAYTNADFTDLEHEPKQLFYHPKNGSCIDGDIIYKDGKFNLFFKTEGSGNGIKKAVSDQLTQGYEVLYDQYLQQTNNPVEGAGVFKLINSDEYILMYDMYTSGAYQFTKSTDLTSFKVIDNDISMNFTPRHGTVMPITASEVDRLTKKWATTNNLVVLAAEGALVKKRNVVIDNKLNTVYIPVKRGANLTSFDPGIKVLPGVTMTPTGAVNFSKGSVNYTLSIDGIGTRTYAVTVKEDNNPALDGFYADPEVLYSQKTCKYYIYPTSDGFTGWSGNYFKVFSSANLVDWKDEGIILNLPTDVSWASTNAWAPTIIERKINGAYKYFYYFCAAQKIGVAVADNPTGPFVDSGKALVSSLPSGANGGQQIDPDVFKDPVSGKYLLYWGNGYMGCAELNDDMVSINNSTIKVLTPDKTFREGTEMIYRNGTYYFMWSDDDTRSPNYCVRYATSSSPTGPWKIPANNLVIAKDAANGIYATGHNCVIQVPGKDEWYIIYHRFTRPKGIKMGDAAGFNREVCIDSLKFNVDGSIIQVTPTLKGIAPVKNTK
jgi:hypothetical protein